MPLMDTGLCHRWKDAKAMVEDIMASSTAVEPLVVKHINTNDWNVKVQTTRRSTEHEAVLYRTDFQSRIENRSADNTSATNFCRRDLLQAASPRKVSSRI